MKYGVPDKLGHNLSEPHQMQMTLEQPCGPEVKEISLFRAYP